MAMYCTNCGGTGYVLDFDPNRAMSGFPPAECPKCGGSGDDQEDER